MRLVTRVASVVLGIALVAAGLLVIVDVVLAAFGKPVLLLGRHGGYTDLVGARLYDARSIGIAVGVGVLGLIILVAELWPRRAVTIPTALDPRWFLRRRSLEHQVTRAARARPGVKSAKTNIRRQRKRWLTTVNVTGQPESQPIALETTQNVLTRMGAPNGTIRILRRR